MSPLVPIVATGLAALTSAAVTPLVRRLATHVGMLDAVGDRRMHEQPKPRIGGIAVYLGFAFALFAIVGWLIAHGSLHDLAPNERERFEVLHDALGTLFGATLILAVGIWDDIMGMAPRAKLGAQLVVAGISLLYGFTIPWIGDPFHPGAHPIVFLAPITGAVLTLIWYVGMMNAINFIDGLDGLLSGVTAIAGAFMAVIAWTHGQPLLAIVLGTLVGGALGFLPYNFNPATIILGDSGALFIGYVFATTSITAQAKTAVAISLAIPILVLALPIVDTAAAIVRRTRAGKKFYEADRGHFHHQLVFRFGMNVRQAVLLIYALCCALGAVAYWLSTSGRAA